MTMSCARCLFFIMGMMLVQCSSFFFSSVSHKLVLHVDLTLLFHYAFV